MSYQLGTQELTEKGTWTAVLAETIGSLILVLMGTAAIVATDVLQGLSGAIDSARLVVIALAFGASYAAVLAATVGMSGGHINPVVTFAAILTKRISIAKGVAYWVGQVVGAIVAAYLLQQLLADAIEGSLGAVAMNVGALQSLEAGLIVEGLLGATLVYVVMTTVIVPGRAASANAPLVVGLIVAAGTLVAFALTGAAGNPARVLGPALVADAFDNHLYYWVGPMAGAAVAVLGLEGVLLRRAR